MRTKPTTGNSFGTDTIAAWTAYGKVDSIFWMIMGAYGVSITTFAGQNFGAGKYGLQILRPVSVHQIPAVFAFFTQNE